MKFLIILLFPLQVFAMGQKMPKPGPNDKQYIVQGLVAEKQKSSNWCAAAAARVMMSFKIKNLPSQCEIISKVIGKDCFNTPIFTEEALRAYGFKAQRIAPSFSRVVSEIKQGRPVTIYHAQGAGTETASGHAVVAYGTYSTSGRDYIIIYDPYYGRVQTWNSDYVVGNLQWYGMVVMK